MLFLGFGVFRNRQFAPRPLVRATNLLAETWEKLDLHSSRRDPLCAPRTAWQKVGDFWICPVRAAIPCALRELLGRKFGIFELTQFAPRTTLAPRTLFYSTFSKL